MVYGLGSNKDIWDVYNGVSLNERVYKVVFFGFLDVYDNCGIVGKKGFLFLKIMFLLIKLKIFGEV